MSLSLKDGIVLLILGIMACGAIYAWVYTKPRNWHFGLLAEKEVREKAKLEQIKSGMADIFDRAWGVVVPIESHSISKLPTQVYEGESELIVLHPRLNATEDNDSLLIVNLATTAGDEKNIKSLQNSRTELENYAVLKLAHKKMNIRQNKKGARYLAIKLIASGFDVAGELRQRQELENTNMIYTWGLTAKSSGNHKLALALYIENGTGEELAQIGTIFHQIKVVSIMNLTQRQVRVVAGVVGFITTILAILQTLHQLKIIP